MNNVTRTQLIEARKYRQWSQQELAGLIGTTQNNISRWERGITTPGPYFRAKLCELFDRLPQDLGLLNDQEIEKPQPTPGLAGTNTSLPAPDQCVSYWCVPYARNPFFTGRDHLLHSLHTMLQQQNGGAAALTQSYALYGLGGIGKTQIALEYAYLYAPAYTAILWVSAETSETLLASFNSLADVLLLPERNEQDQTKVISAVIRWLERKQEWLLIFDNVEDLTLLQPFLPAARQGSILLTTRLQSLGTFAQQIIVECMNEEEGRIFLLQRARLLQPSTSLTHLSSTDVLAAQIIVEEMDGLPLALDQDRKSVV